MRILLVALVVLLSGCVCNPERVVTVPQEVEVPVPVRCSVKFPTPPKKLVVEALGPSVRDRVVALIQENDDYRAYSKELEAALASCADNKTQ